MFFTSIMKPVKSVSKYCSFDLVVGGLSRLMNSVVNLAFGIGLTPLFSSFFISQTVVFI